MPIPLAVPPSGEVDLTGSGYRAEGELRADAHVLGDGLLLDEVRTLIAAAWSTARSCAYRTAPGRSRATRRRRRLATAASRAPARGDRRQHPVGTTETATPIANTKRSCRLMPLSPATTKNTAPIATASAAGVHNAVGLELQRTAIALRPLGQCSEPAEPGCPCPSLCRGGQQSASAAIRSPGSSTRRTKMARSLSTGDGPLAPSILFRPCPASRRRASSLERPATGCSVRSGVVRSAVRHPEPVVFRPAVPQTWKGTLVTMTFGSGASERRSRAAVSS
jgi:hypothetical protein